MNLLLRCLVVYTLLMGAVERAVSATSSDLNAQAKITVIEGLGLSGKFSSCYSQKNLRDYLEKPLVEAHHFFLGKQKEGSCLQVNGLVYVRKILSPYRNGDGGRLCIVMIEVPTLWGPKLHLYVGLPVTSYGAFIRRCVGE